MPFNGAGVYSAPAADFPVVTQTVISSTHFNNTINDIATALSTCLTKDGQQVATANIPFGGFRATNVGITAIAGSVGTPAINVSDTGTGLYRSAASELAVAVAGSQVARFASTGLIVTGAASVSTTLTASTSVVTPLVASASGEVVIAPAGTSRWRFDNTAGILYPTTNLQDIGIPPSNLIGHVFTPIIDSGTTGSVSLKTNNGTKQVEVFHLAAAANFVTLQGAATGSFPRIGTQGSDAAVGIDFVTLGAAGHNFRTDVGGANAIQLQVTHTPAANRNITITGSNGGNPTIGVTAGSLAITPAVVMASTLSAVGITSTGDVVVSGKRLQGAKGAGLTTANNFTLGSDGNYFTFSGGTQVNLIDSTGWQAGSIVTLSSGVLTTFKNNQGASGAFKPIILQGGVDFAMNSNATLTLCFDGSQWFEIARRTP